jgi:hypothetical protein
MLMPGAYVRLCATTFYVLPSAKQTLNLSMAETEIGEETWKVDLNSRKGATKS